MMKKLFNSNLVLYSIGLMLMCALFFSSCSVNSSEGEPTHVHESIESTSSSELDSQGPKQTNESESQTEKTDLESETQNGDVPVINDNLKLISIQLLDSPNEQVLRAESVPEYQLLASVEETEPQKSIEVVSDNHQRLCAIVKNVERDSFIDLVLYLSWKDTYVVFNEGNGEYTCASTTVYEDGMWVTKIEFDLDIGFDNKFEAYVDVQQITFLHSDNKRINASIQGKEVSQLWFGIEYKNKTFSMQNDTFRFEITVNDNDAIAKIETILKENAEIITIPHEVEYSDYRGQHVALLTVIPDSVFSNRLDLTTVLIANGVSIIGDGAFYGCSNLTSIEIPDSVTSIGNNAFHGCSGLTSIEIPDSVTNIGNYGFYGCSGLTSIEIPDSVTNIGNCGFYGCSNLTSIEIPDSVTNIGYCGFYDCSGLTSIEIPDSVIYIGSHVFDGCSNLKSIEISLGQLSFFSSFERDLMDEYNSGISWNQDPDYSFEEYFSEKLKKAFPSTDDYLNGDLWHDGFVQLKKLGKVFFMVSQILK